MQYKQLQLTAQDICFFISEFPIGYPYLKPVAQVYGQVILALFIGGGSRGYFIVGGNNDEVFFPGVVTAIVSRGCIAAVIGFTAIINFIRIAYLLLF
jgi:hypothetical protein